MFEKTFEQQETLKISKSSGHQIASVAKNKKSHSSTK